MNRCVVVIKGCVYGPLDWDAAEDWVESLEEGVKWAIFELYDPSTFPQEMNDLYVKFFCVDDGGSDSSDLS